MNVDDLTLEQWIERLRMALAEVGYPHAGVYESTSWPGFAAIGKEVPMRVAWRAYVVTGDVSPCFKCWVEGDHEQCLDPGVEDCGLSR